MEDNFPLPDPPAHSRREAREFIAVFFIDHKNDFKHQLFAQALFVFHKCLQKLPNLRARFFNR